MKVYVLTFQSKVSLILNFNHPLTILFTGQNILEWKFNFKQGFENIFEEIKKKVNPFQISFLTFLHC